MSSNETVGGFVGDPIEAFNPPAAGGCCGSAPTAVASTAPALTAADSAPVASTCCGTVADAQAAGACCGAEAKSEAVAAGAGCCG